MVKSAQKPAQKPIIDDARSKLLRLETELNATFLERSDLIRIILLAVLTRQHVLIFGKPGAAKSSVVRAAASAISAGCFTVQLGKDTTRDEVFGPVKLSQLPHDKLCRAYDRFLPGQPFAFIDEIDKGNSIILNSLYTAMEEREFADDGIMHKIPLVSLFGAANNIAGFQSDALAPLLDRFLFRVEVDWLQSDSNFLQFVRRKAERDEPVLTTALSLQEIVTLQDEVQQVQFPRDTQESLGKLRKDLIGEGIQASERRWGYIIDLLKAAAFLNGNSFVSEEHFQVLRHVLWTDKKQIPVIDRLLKAMDQGLSANLKALLKTISGKVAQTLQLDDPQELIGEAALTLSDLHTLEQQIIKLPINNKTRKVLDAITQMILDVQNYRTQVCQ